ncbi:g protein-coupled receptor [Anaeramoeba flamelloides]|uniref:G protein-coupled receptor n=1 Tax=Anaeramoeba flamelloides TaxID=1746091 RepID=A0ABQ8YCN4_9EUKA|nr:g protein-coupled receptor [Anaeramoeba flamelloides]
MFFFGYSIETYGTFLGSGLSVLGAILTFWFSRHVTLNMLPFKHYLTVLSFFDFFIGMILFIPGPKMDTFCSFQAASLCFIWPWPIGFSAMLSLMIYLQIVHGWELKRLSQIILPLWCFLILVCSIVSTCVYYYSSNQLIHGKTW